MTAAHRWFLDRGLPLVLTPRVRSHDLIERTVPAFSVAALGFAVHDIAVAITDTGSVDTGVLVRLTLVVVALVLAPVVLRAMSRSRRTARRAAAWAAMAISILGVPLAVGPAHGWNWHDSVGLAVIAVATLVLTYLGVGAIALWALRFAWGQFGALGTLMSRALPLLMLTVMVYFTNEIWQLAARASGRRLWQTTAFLALVAVAFMIATIRDEVRELREGSGGSRDTVALLRGTPLACDEEPPHVPLSWGEKLNVVAVMVVAQAIQVMFFAGGLFAFFLALGEIAVPADLAVLWSGEQACTAGGPPPCGVVVAGVPLPFGRTAVHTALFVAVLSGLYFTVSSSVDPMYRQRFFDPLVGDVRVSLAGRDSYLNSEAP